MTNAATLPVRQGDLVFRPTSDRQPTGNVEVKQPKNGRLVIAEGEVTGHTHGFDIEEDGGPEITFFTQREYSGRRGSTERQYIRVVGGTATLTHDEHGEIEFPEGTYEVLFQTEYEPKVGQRRVFD